MTTIAFKDGIIASDSLLRNGYGNDPNEITKLFMLKDGSIAGGVGVYAKIFSFVRYLDGEEKIKIDLGDETTVIHFKHDGSLDIYEDCGMYNQQGEYNAFGSGSPFAISAMALGLSAIEAVEFASRFDAGMGGNIQSMKWEIKV